MASSLHCWHICSPTFPLLVLLHLPLLLYHLIKAVDHGIYIRVNVLICLYAVGMHIRPDMQLVLALLELYIADVAGDVFRVGDGRFDFQTIQLILQQPILPILVCLPLVVLIMSPVVLEQSKTWKDLRVLRHVRHSAIERQDFLNGLAVVLPFEDVGELVMRISAPHHYSTVLSGGSTKGENAITARLIALSQHLAPGEHYSTVRPRGFFRLDDVLVRSRCEPVHFCE